MGTILTSPEAGLRYSARFDVEILACANCSMPFGITTAFGQRRKEDHKTFYCPNGHSNYYPQDNDEELLRKKVKRLEGNLQWERDQRQAADADAKHQRRVAAAAKGRVTRMRNRVAAGVCPVDNCKRSGLGADMKAHIESCHPHWHDVSHVLDGNVD